LSYLGGHPQLPPSIEWPIADPNSGQLYANRPIAFLAQIDCSEIPDFDGRSILPEEGTLFFFYNTCEWDYYPGEEPLGRVIYYPESVNGFAPRRPPDDFVEYEPESHEDRFPWKHAQGERSDCYTRWDVDLYPFVDQVVTDPNVIDELGGQIMFEEIARAVGGIPSESGIEEAYRFLGDSSEGVFARSGFPFSWVQVELVTARLRYEIELKNTVSRGAYFDNPNTGPAARRFIEESDHWLALARQNGRFTRPSPEHLPSFENFCRSFERAIGDKHHHFWRAVRAGLIWGADLCVAESAEASKLIPDQLIELLRPLHAPARRYPDNRYGVESWMYDFPTHQILGFGRGVQGRPRGLENHLLLLQLETDGRHFSWGDVGNIHYLITESDLRAKRFDNVVVVMAGH
jgi:uncharacterized protein YwqG